MKTVTSMFMLLLILTACSKPNLSPSSGPKGVKVPILAVGVGFDGKEIAIGAGGLKDKVAVITFYGPN